MLVCLSGSLNGFSRIVMPSCDRAVEVAPEKPSTRTARGIARTLTGNYHGALVDFEFAVKSPDEERLIEVKQLQAWIVELKKGHNPVDQQTLKKLHDQLEIE